jgi:hypothetical protein
MNALAGRRCDATCDPRTVATWETEIQNREESILEYVYSKRERSVKDLGRVFRHTVSACEPTALFVQRYSATRCWSFCYSSESRSSRESA